MRGRTCLAGGLPATAHADLTSAQVSTLVGVGVTVLVPGPGQPFADQVPTSVITDVGVYDIEYGTAPTFAIVGSTSDNRVLTAGYVCGDDSVAYCTDIALVSADGEQSGDEVFRGLAVGDATATAEHVTCCNGRGWRVEWSANGAFYSLMWKGFAPDVDAFDPGNAVYAQALADVAAQLTPLAVPAAPAAPSAAPAPAPSTTCGAPANPWGYNFCGNGTRVRTPDPSLCSYFQCIPSFWKQTNEYVAQCRDGLLSHSGGVSGACSGHHGEAQPLYGP